MERAKSGGSCEGRRSKNPQLLSMKWDNIGLQQTQYSNTFNLHQLQSEDKQAFTAAGDHPSNLFEVLTEEGQRGPGEDETPVAPGEVQANTLIHLQDEVNEESPAAREVV